MYIWSRSSLDYTYANHDDDDDDNDDQKKLNSS